MMPHQGDPADGQDPLRSKLPHAIIHMPQGHEDGGYETDATAFSDAGGYTTEEEGPHAHSQHHKRRFPASSLLGKPPALKSAGGAHAPG